MSESDARRWAGASGDLHNFAIHEALKFLRLSPAQKKQAYLDTLRELHTSKLLTSAEVQSLSSLADVMREEIEHGTVRKVTAELFEKVHPDGSLAAITIASIAKSSAHPETGHAYKAFWSWSGWLTDVGAAALGLYGGPAVAVVVAAVASGSVVWHQENP
ncbi:MAG: hypothetical protein ACRETW_00410 [Stenotrophobium sp.]